MTTHRIRSPRLVRRPELAVTPYCLRCSHAHDKRDGCPPLCAACSQRHAAGEPCPHDGELAWDTQVRIGEAEQRQRNAAPSTVDWQAVVDEMQMLDQAYLRLRGAPVEVEATITYPARRHER